jgi:molybdopterin synthase catalytic subunit
MKCSIRIFAGVREAIGTDRVSIDINPAISARQFKETLADHYPQAADLIRISRMAVSSTFVEDDAPLPTDSDIELALIPPVSGG